MTSSTSLSNNAQRSLAEGMALAEAGARVVGIFGHRVPLEPIYAAGFTPVQLSLDISKPTPAADGVLSKEAKPMVKAMLELVLSGALKFCDLVVFAPPFAPMSVHIEELRRLGMLQQPMPPSYYFELPMFQGEQQLDFAVERTRALAQRLAAVNGASIDEKALEAAIVDSNQLSRAVQSLNASRLTPHAPLGSCVIDAISQTRWRAPADAVSIIEAAGTEQPTNLPRVLLVSSSVLGDSRLHQLVERSGANIVGEDDVFGSAYAHSLIEEGSGDALSAIARFYHDNATPQRTGPLELRRAWYREQIQRSDIDGVIFYAEDPIWGWDVPEMTEQAHANGLQTLFMMKDVRLESHLEAITSLLNDFVASLNKEGVA